MEHAFATTITLPDVSPAVPTYYQWYWGRLNKYNGVPATHLRNTYLGIQMAGPNLTAETFRDGMFGVPPERAAAAGASGSRRTTTT